MAGLTRSALHAQLTGAVQVVLHVRREGRRREVHEISVLGAGSDGLVTAVPAMVHGRLQEPGASTLRGLLRGRGQVVPW